MRIRSLTPLIPLALVSGVLVTPVSFAQSLSDNPTYFTGEPPSLVSVETPDTSVNWPSAHYYFTFNLPSTSPESLGQVTITQEVSGETIEFNLQNTKAFQGNPKQIIDLKSVTQDPQTQTITIVFASPVAPNTQFTISLEATQNPSEDGTYIFRVQGFPDGNNPVGLDLGVGQLSFYRLFR